MVRAYEDKGCFEAKVTADEEALKQGNLRLVVSEGPRLHLRDIRFEGNTSFKTQALDHEIADEVPAQRRRAPELLVVPALGVEADDGVVVVRVTDGVEASSGDGHRREADADVETSAHANSPISDKPTVPKARR